MCTQDFRPLTNFRIIEWLRPTPDLMIALQLVNSLKYYISNSFVIFLTGVRPTTKPFCEFFVNKILRPYRGVGGGGGGLF